MEKCHFNSGGKWQIVRVRNYDREVIGACTSVKDAIETIRGDSSGDISASPSKQRKGVIVVNVGFGDLWYELVKMV